MAKTKTLPQTLTIARDEGAPESMQLVAKAILQIDDAFTRMRKGVKDELIILLIHDLTKLSKTDIRLVLNAVPRIKQAYLR